MLDHEALADKMKYEKHYVDHDWWYAVYRNIDNGEMILVAAVPGVGMYDIAMKLDTTELALFQNSKNDFTALAKDFVASRNMPIFRDRMIRLKTNTAEMIETEE